MVDCVVLPIGRGDCTLIKYNKLKLEIEFKPTQYGFQHLTQRSGVPHLSVELEKAPRALRGRWNGGWASNRSDSFERFSYLPIVECMNSLFEHYIVPSRIKGLETEFNLLYEQGESPSPKIGRWSRQPKPPSADGGRRS